MERGPGLGRVARRIANGARTQSAGCFPAPRAAGLDDLRVVILSILVHGLTMSPLLRWFGMCGDRGPRRVQVTRGELQAAHAALRELDEMAHIHFTRHEVVASLRREYEQKIAHDRGSA